MNLERLIALVTSIALAAASFPSVRVAAQAQAPTPVTPQQVIQSGSGLSISGTVVQSDRMTPVANARLRLRKVDTDAIVDRNVSDNNGAFSFSVSEAGMYLVEVVDDDDAVLAVSSAIDLAAIPVTAALVVLPSVVGAAAFFSSTAFLVLSAAGAAGVTALAVQAAESDQSVASPEQ